MGDLLRAAIELLADGEWHSYARVVNKLARQVQPGPAHRTAEDRRTWRYRSRHGEGAEPPERSHGEDGTDVMLYGGRDRARKTLGNPLWFEYDVKGKDPNKRVRLTPDAFQKVQERDAPKTTS